MRNLAGEGPSRALVADSSLGAHGQAVLRWLFLLSFLIATPAFAQTVIKGPADDPNSAAIVGYEDDSQTTGGVVLSVPSYFYWTAYSPDHSASVEVGPYPSLAICRDMLGSASYSHPFLCHTTGPNPPANCRNLGTGFAYPKGWPYPVPADKRMVSEDCHVLPRGPYSLPMGWYFLSGDAPNHVTIQAAGGGRYVKAGELAKTKPGAWIAQYKINGGVCPGAPFFSVGGPSTACE